jgi:hypothetical protein
MNATRERKLKFLKDGNLSLHVGVTEMLSKLGDDWLTDDQLDDIVRYQIDIHKNTQRRNRENRKINRSRLMVIDMRARELSRTMQCNCDLDNWQPEPSTGHSRVCRIHKAAVTP